MSGWCPPYEPAPQTEEGTLEPRGTASEQGQSNASRPLTLRSQKSREKRFPKAQHTIQKPSSSVALLFLGTPPPSHLLHSFPQSPEWQAQSKTPRPPDLAWLTMGGCGHFWAAPPCLGFWSYEQAWYSSHPQHCSFAPTRMFRAQPIWPVHTEVHRGNPLFPSLKLSPSM